MSRTLVVDASVAAKWLLPEPGSDAAVRLLEERGVALVPGTAFGAPGYLRISFAASVDTLREAIDRIEAFVSS